MKFQSFKTQAFRIAFIGIFCTVFASAQQTLYLRDGRTLEGSFTGVADGRLSWQMEVGSTKVPLDRIDYISFPAPRIWDEMMTTFDNGDYVAATAGFLPVSTNKSRSTFYPAPGNFANLAQRRLLDCYRKTRNWAELRYTYSKMEWDKLPVREQEVRPAMAVWAAIGGEEWDEALKLAAEAEPKVPGMTNELGFARAIAYKGKGDPNGAVIALAEAYGPHPGMDRALAKEAMEEAATILRADSERQPELQALIHIYAGLFGQGKLWKGADPLSQELLAKALDSAAPTTNKSAQKAAADGKALVRYIRISKKGTQRWGLSVGEVQVMNDGYNIARKGTPKLSSPRTSGFEPKLAIDGKTDKPGEFSATTLNAVDPYWELDLGDILPVDSVIIWSALDHSGGVADSLNSFQLELFDGDRKEVFAARDLKKPSPKLEVKVVPKSE